MSAAPGDSPRDDSFEDEGSPAQDAKDSEVKHVVSLRRQDPTPSDDAPAPPVEGSPRRPRSDDAPEVEGSPDDVEASQQPPTPAATRRWRKAKHAVSLRIKPMYRARARTSIKPNQVHPPHGSPCETSVRQSRGPGTTMPGCCT